MTETSLGNGRRAVISDPLGLHLRAATKLVSLAQSFRSEILIIAKGTTANAKSVLDLATLGAGCGTVLDIVAHGPDAGEAVAALNELIVAGLDDSMDRDEEAA